MNKKTEKRICDICGKEKIIRYFKGKNKTCSNCVRTKRVIVHRIGWREPKNYKEILEKSREIQRQKEMGIKI